MRLARWWAHRRLWAGRCPQCGTILPDDARRGALCGARDCADADELFWRTW